MLFQIIYNVFMYFIIVDPCTDWLTDDDC